MMHGQTQIKFRRKY